MTPKHTPGPWAMRNDCGLAVDAHGGTVALVNTIEECGDADARLIAAAPDILSALQTLTEHANETYPHFEDTRGQADIAAARAAIAKAQGNEVKP